MPRAVLLFMTAVLLAVSCAPPAGSATGSPSKTVDIKRSRLDIVYSAFVDQDLHHVTSKKALEGALDGVRAAVRAAGGKDDVATPQFQDVDEPQTADFNKFADAAGQLAGRVQLSADGIADAGIAGMLGASPDCHTYYVPAGGSVVQSRQFTPNGSNAIIPPQGTSLGGPDEAGLTGKMLPGGIAYITFRQWIVTGTYKLNDAVRAMLDKAVAQGAKAWIFDLRGNPGGIVVDISSFFLSGEPTRGRLLKNGNGGTSSSNKDLRLPDAYQLPIAIVANDRSASASEHFILDLKEGKRATFVGQKTYGCLGAAIETRLLDGGLLSITVEEVTGGITGARYNNAGIAPDVQADDLTAVDKAVEILKQKIANGG
jgi:peptidase S41-like protein